MQFWRWALRNTTSSRLINWSLRLFYWVPAEPLWYWQRNELSDRWHRESTTPDADLPASGVNIIPILDGYWEGNQICSCGQTFQSYPCEVNQVSHSGNAYCLGGPGRLATSRFRRHERRFLAPGCRSGLRGSGGYRNVTTAVAEYWPSGRCCSGAAAAVPYSGEVRLGPSDS